MAGLESIRTDEPGLAPDDFIAAIWQARRDYVRAGRIKQPHPWRVAVGTGKVPRAGVAEYVKNRYYFLVNINRKDAQIIANCPYPEARRMLLRKYIDEEGQDVVGGGLGAHYEMWLKVAEALGVPTRDYEQFCRCPAGLPLHRRRGLRLREEPELDRGRRRDLRDRRGHVEALHAEGGVRARRFSRRRRGAEALLRSAGDGAAVLPRPQRRERRARRHQRAHP